MVLTKEKAQAIVDKAGGMRDSIISMLRKSGYEPEVYYLNEDDSPRHWNVRVANQDGSHVRIYRNFRGEILVQIWNPMKVEWSGIPTFMPSGKGTLREWF